MHTLLAGTAMVFFSVSALAGPLTPPGVVAPTMKTLEEVEPRTQIGQADVPMSISLAGSYYLTGNLLAVGLPDQFVIEIASDNVTLDLRGFTITGSSEVSQAFDGVRVLGGLTGVTIRNGVIEKCLDKGIDAKTAGEVIVEGIRAIGNFDDGIVISGGVVRGCVASNNGGSGIEANVLIGGLSATIVDCVANGNQLSGIETAFGCSIQNCVVRDSGVSGVQAGASNTIMNTAVYNSGADGFFVGAGSSLTNCSSAANGDDGFFVAGGSQVTGCTSYINTGDGFTTNFNASFIGNNAYLNDEHGFNLTTDCVAIENTSNGNGVVLVGGAGIFVSGAGNRIEGNHMSDNDFGLDVNGVDNLIIRNSTQGNGFAYSIVGGGNLVGPILTDGTIGANSNPAANYAY